MADDGVNMKEVRFRTMTETVVGVRDDEGHGYDLVQYEDTYLPVFFKMLLKGLTVGDKLKQVKSMTYQDGDVLICSYPKTGSHWLCNLVSMLLDPNFTSDNVDDVCSVAPPLLELYAEEAVTTLKSPRVLLTHLGIDRIPTALKEKAKLVFIVRNPKDACVSLYHHYRRLPQLQNKQSWESVVHHFMNGPLSWGTYGDFLLKLHRELTDSPDFKPYILYFEDLKKDRLGELRKLQEYLCLHHSDDHLEAVLDRCSIDKLKQDVEEGKVKTPLLDKDGKSILYRKGEIGEWKTHFNEEQNEKFDTFWSDIMKDTSFKFQYN